MEKIHTLFKVSLSSILALTATLLFMGCPLKSTKTGLQPGESSAARETSAAMVAKGVDEISVMSFNVENLFDAEHDAGTEDYTNMPLTKKNTPEVQNFCKSISNPFYQKECLEKDWNEDLIKFKLSQIGKVIRFVDGGHGPDNLLLIEVENIKILNRLVKDQLADLGYKTVVLLEGPDTRGIDPGFISKFPMVGKPKLHLVPYTDSDPEKLKYAKKSRGILEVTVELPNKKQLTFLVGHFPSQSNPTAWRRQAIEFMTGKVIEYQAAGRAVVAGGDLNIISTEEESEGYFKNLLSQAAQVSHLVGCKQCDGTHNYKGHWDFLDVLAFSKNIDRVGLTLIPESIQVVKVAHHLRPNGTPARFNDEKKEGVADHFPLYSRLKISK